MYLDQMSRDYQEILVHNFQKRLGFVKQQRCRQELKDMLYEMQHIVMTYPLDDDIMDAMSSIVDRIIAVITVNDVYNKPRRLQ